MSARGRWWCAVAVGCIALVACACGSGSGAPLVTGTDAHSSEFNGVDAFHTAVAKPIKRHFTIYWLGPEFDAGPRTFRGPSFAEYSADNTSERFDIQYDPGATGDGLHLTHFSRADAADGVRRLTTGVEGNVSSHAARAGSRTVTVYRIPLAGHPLNMLVVVIDLGDTTVVASSGIDASHPDATPNPNPLVDEPTMLSVLANLRPYPQ